MSERSPNFSLNLYGEQDGQEKFSSFVQKLTGPEADSNMMRIDAVLKEHADKLEKAAMLDENGKVPDVLPLTGGTLTGPLSIGSDLDTIQENFPDEELNEKLLMVGDNNIAIGIGAAAIGRQNVVCPGEVFECSSTGDHEVYVEDNTFWGGAGDKMILTTGTPTVEPQIVEILRAEVDEFGATIIETTSFKGNIAYAILLKATSSAKHYYSGYAEGSKNISTGLYGSHAEGFRTAAIGSGSHSEGKDTRASGDYSHAEGSGSVANGANSHAEGKYNIEDVENKYLHIAGNGNSNTQRSNAYTLDWDGNGWYAGKVSAGTAENPAVPTQDNDLVTKKYLETTKPPRTCTFVVGTSTAGWTEADCDYLCDGVDDQVEIQAALDAVNAKGGGEVKLLEGTYNISARLNVKDYTKFTGSGKGTRLKREVSDIFLITTSSDCVLSHFSVEGSTAGPSSAGGAEIYLNGAFNTVFNVAIYGANQMGIRASGDGSHITCCEFSECKVAVRLSNNSTVSHSYFEGGQTCINVTGASSVISGNTLNNSISGIWVNGEENSVTGNTLYTVENGIELGTSSICKGGVISGNIITGFCGVGIWGYRAELCRIEGNILLMSKNVEEDYVELQETIHMESDCKNCTVAHNTIPGKNYVNDGGASNEFLNNRVSIEEVAEA